MFTLAAYRSIFSDPVKVRFFLNSYLVAGVVTLLTVLIAILTAYAFSRYKFRVQEPAQHLSSSARRPSRRSRF